MSRLSELWAKIFSGGLKSTILSLLGAFLVYYGHSWDTVWISGQIWWNLIMSSQLSVENVYIRPFWNVHTHTNNITFVFDIQNNVYIFLPIHIYGKFIFVWKDDFRQNACRKSIFFVLTSAFLIFCTPSLKMSFPTLVIQILLINNGFLFDLQRA